MSGKFWLTISEKMSARANNKDLSLLLEMLRPSKADVILDVGAGTGWIASKVALICDETYALEPKTDRLDFMTQKHREVKAFSATAQSVPFPENYFNKIYVVFAFHHFQDQGDSLEEFRRILKPGGFLLIHEYFKSRSTLGSYIERKLLRSKLRFLDPADLEGILNEHFFKKESIRHGAKGYFLLASKL